MIWTFEAIFENGVFRPLKPLEGVPDRTSVDVTVTTHDRAPSAIPGNGVQACVGSISSSDAAEMKRIVQEEFEKVDERDW